MERMSLNKMNELIASGEYPGDPDYYKVLKIPEKTCLMNYIPNLIKRIPNKVNWATITIHLDNDTEDLFPYVVYDHNNKKIIRDRRQFANEHFGKNLVLRAVSNIDYGEYYYDIWISKKHVRMPKKVEKTIKDKKPVQQTIITTKKKRSINYDNKTKDQLKKILKKRNVRVYYHDTLDILRQKCRESEE